jgi:hypothetical protein
MQHLGRSGLGIDLNLADVQRLGKFGISGEKLATSENPVSSPSGRCLGT